MISYGNSGKNLLPVTHGDGYDNYQGLGGDDVYSVDPMLTESVTISDSLGVNTVVLGEAEIVSSQFFAGGALFTYASGGVVKVLGDMSNFTFVFGGQIAFDPTVGGTSKTFEETVTAFGADPESLSLTGMIDGTISGKIHSDGTVGEGGTPEPEAGTLAIGDVTVDEDAGTATFTIVLGGAAPAAGESVSVDFATADGTAVDGTDYTATSGSLTFGEGEKTKTIEVPILGNEIVDGDKVFTVNLSNVAGTVGGQAVAISDGEATATIEDNDELGFTFTAAKAEIHEGAVNVFTVEASSPVPVNTEVVFQLHVDKDGDTAQLDDFASGSFNEKVVVIKAGETTATFDVESITNDGTELSEKYTVTATVNGTEYVKQVTLLDGSEGGGQNFVLTTGLDILPGMTGSDGNAVTSGDDTVIGVLNLGDDGTNITVETDTTYNATDQINAGEGNDTMKLIIAGDTSGAAKDYTVPANFEGVETFEISSSLAMKSSQYLNVDTSSVDGLAELKLTKTASDVVIKAAADTNINADLAAKDYAVDGGKDVNVTLTDLADGWTGRIQIGSVSVAKGNVSLETTGVKTTAGNDVDLTAGGVVDVTGGKVISVIQHATSDASAAVTDITGSTVKLANVDVTGSADTTEVFVQQDVAAEVKAKNAVAGKDGFQKVTFTALAAGELVNLSFDNGTNADFLQFKAKTDMTAEEVAEAFANLSKGALQGSVSAEKGIYTSGGLGISKWSSGAAEGASVTFTGTGSDIATAVTIADNSSTTAPTIGALEASVAAVAAKAGVLGSEAGQVVIEDSTTATIKTITVDGYAASSKIGATNATTVLETLNLSNAGNTVDMTVADTADTLALTVENLGEAAGGAKVILTAAPTTLNVKSVGKNKIDMTAAATEALNVTGDDSLSLEAAALAGVKTVTVKETAGLRLHGGESATLTSVDTTETTGTVSVTIDGTKATYAGGEGKDVVKVSSTTVTKTINLGGGHDTLDWTGAVPASASEVIDGGAGTDLLELKAADAASLSATAAFQAGFTNFEQLWLGALTADAVVNLDNMNDINYVITHGDGGVDKALTLDKMLANATVMVSGNHSTSTTNPGITVKLADASGDADVVNLIANDGACGTVAVNDVETINIQSVEAGAALTLKANKAETINVTGGKSLNLTLDAATKAVTLIDATAMAGKKGLTVETLAGDDGATTVKGSAGVDMLTVQGANDVLEGGAGNDVLAVKGGVASAVTLTGGEGVDTFDFSAFTAANAGSAATITDLEKGESIKLVANATAHFASAKVQLIDEATFTEYVTEAAAQADAAAETFAGGAAAKGVAWFQFNNNTFVVQDIDGDANFTDGTDIIVKIQGMVDLSDSSFNADDQGNLLYL